MKRVFIASRYWCFSQIYRSKLWPSYTIRVYINFDILSGWPSQFSQSLIKRARSATEKCILYEKLIFLSKHSSIICIYRSSCEDWNHHRLSWVKHSFRRISFEGINIGWFDLFYLWNTLNTIYRSGFGFLIFISPFNLRSVYEQGWNTI